MDGRLHHVEGGFAGLPGGLTGWLAGLILATLCSAPATAQAPDSAPATAGTSRADDLAGFVEGFPALLDRNLEAALARALELGREARARSDDAALAVALAAEAGARFGLEGPDTALPLLERALSLATASSDAGPLPVAWVQLVRARVLLIRGDHGRALHAVTAALESAADLPGSSLGLRARLTEYWVLRSIDSLGDARPPIERMRSLAGAEELAPWIDHAEQDCLWHEGLIAESEELARSTLEQARRTGDLRLEAACEYDLGWIRWDEADHEPALGHLRRSRELARELGDVEAQALALELEACVLRDEDRLPEALITIREALALVEGRGFRPMVHEIYGTATDVAILLEDTEALLCFSRASSDSWELLFGDESWQDLLALRGDLRRAEKDRQAAEELLAEQSAEQSARTRRLVGLLAGLAFVLLGALTASLLVGRRRLARTNERLAAEARAAREAQQARARLEEKMRQLERLRGLGLIAGGIAHDFNNLLMGVLGNAELLLESKVLGPDERSLAEGVTASADRAAALCRQLLSYAGEEGGERGPVDLDALVERMLPVLRAAVSRGVLIELERSATPTCACGNPTQIEQTLLNLITNARDAGAKRVQVRLRSERLTPEQIAEARFTGVATPGPHAVLEVEDDGEGITEELLAHVFDPFFTTRFPGRGLGLAAVYGIASGHGGAIRSSSRPGLGTCFTIYLPAADPGPEPALPAPVEVASDGPSFGLALVVDDDPDVRTLAARMLELEGLRTVVADGAEAALFEAGRLSEELTLVLLDVTMPGGDGPPILTPLRERLPEARLVLMTGHDERELLRRSDFGRPDAILRKPFTRESLRRTLARARSTSR